ncbi:hypothetical protein [Kineosporia sp. R_H_3]|uniref:hypothetical protein n=1 Tax=Kineosporia sp. R_H_3 TaxID=1961848 RepID=UPI00117A5A5A|nr:hypothetical protein [Kineosporia sp. R_H_3]
MDHRGAAVRSLGLVVLVVCGALAGCGDDAASFGPLAVQRPLEGSGDAANEGTLVVTDTCVHLRDARGRLVTLVWESDRVSWDPATRTVTYRDRDDGDLSLVDGDTIVVGGSGDQGGPETEWLDRLDWVSPPAQECRTGYWWSVAGVEEVTGG